MGLHNYQFADKSYTIEATVKEINEKFALLQSSSLIEFKWPIENLPSDLQIGDPVKLKLITKDEDDELRYQQLRNLLNEIVN